ncbi:hypothetical protein A2U01_0070301 [Trifolium medium]|uniref:Uncharacterized protein n=1 Tax=Trifolium medium TaxID=97028 RepID=A0A392SJH7_9FABA|nr:hypothetical protein [Trifolium medium]
MVGDSTTVNDGQRVVEEQRQREDLRRAVEAGRRGVKRCEHGVLVV